ncbi:MAG: dihydrofolate reductase [Rhodothermia bacterium]
MTRETRPELVIVAAVAEKDRLIGNGTRLPWHIPEDLRRFKSLTLGHPLLMGRKTFESILVQFGKTLPDRRHIVLTRDPDRIQHPVAECFPSVDAALEALKYETIVYISGGAAVYEAFLERADRLELTIVEGDYEGDTYFPPWKHLVGAVFSLIERQDHQGFRFETYINADI